MKKISLTLALIFGSFTLTACHTISGVGEDVQVAGGAVSGAASGAGAGM